MIKVLKDLLGKIGREHTAKSPKPIARRSVPKIAGDFRAVEIVPSVLCCTAAKQAMGRSYLLRAAPRLPLMGCTLATNCSCKFLKNADRRGSDRRWFGATEINRLFAGVESRKSRGRRSTEN
jgi:hypothetical protein